MLSSANEATLIRTVPWMNGPHAAAIRASLAANQPASEAAEREKRSAAVRVAATLTDTTGGGAPAHGSTSPTGDSERVMWRPAPGSVTAAPTHPGGLLPDPGAATTDPSTTPEHRR